MTIKYREIPLCFLPFDLLSHFVNRYKGVYSEKSLNFDIPVKNNSVYEVLFCIYVFFFWVSFENSAVQYERVQF